MKGEFSQFIGRPYNFQNGPTTGSKEQNISDGLNCQFLVHLIYREFGLTLPFDMLSKEIFENMELFENILSLERMRTLDVVVFGKQEEQDLKKLHLTIFTGETNETGSPLLIHATSIEKQVSVWSLECSPPFLNIKEFML